jgi:hypothetical protein
MANLMVDSIRDLDPILRPNAGPQPLPKSFSLKDEGMEAVIAFWSSVAKQSANNTQPAPLMGRQFDWLEGAKVISDNGVFLGRISKMSFEADSIGNSVGNYGSSFSPTSIFNTVGGYGSSVSSLSPWNSVTFTPPKIFTADGLHWCYLTINQTLNPRIDPSIVAAYVKSN